MKDENLSRGDSILGTARMSLHALCRSFNIVTTSKLDLQSDGKAAGSIRLSMVLSELSIDGAEDKIPESSITLSNGGVLEIKKMDLKKLPRKKSFGIGGDSQVSHDVRITVRCHIRIRLAVLAPQDHSVYWSNT